MNETIQRAQNHVWSTSRVLEQRRFELLFGENGDPDAIVAALEPYKTPDGGYGYALEPDGRGPTSQPPHIWTALEALDDAGTTDAAVCDHLAAISAPDGGIPVALPTLEPYARAPWWAIGTEGTLLATALHFAPLSKHGVTHAWVDGAEAFCWTRRRRDRADAPVRGRGGDRLPRRGPRPRPGVDRRRAARPARARAGARRRRSPRATRPARSTIRTTSPSVPTASRAPGSPTRRSTRASITSPRSSARTAAGR